MPVPGRGAVRGAAPDVCAAAGRASRPAVAIARTAASAAPDGGASHDRVHSGRLPGHDGLPSGPVACSPWISAGGAPVLRSATRPAPWRPRYGVITAQPPLADVLANGGPARRGIGRAVGHRGGPAAAPRWPPGPQTARGRRLRRPAPDADGAAGRSSRTSACRASRPRRRLRVRERDWRTRKARLDAAAAAVILQDFLDASLSPRSDARDPAPDARTRPLLVLAVVVAGGRRRRCPQPRSARTRATPSPRSSSTSRTGSAWRRSATASSKPASSRTTGRSAWRCGGAARPGR